MVDITPSTGSLSLSGIAPSRQVDSPRTTGYGALRLTGQRATVRVAVNSLVANLPSMLSIFQDRRRLIRSDMDAMRDVLYNIRDTELTLALELNGGVFDGSVITGAEINYTSGDGLTTGTITSAVNPEIFDFTRFAIVRGVRSGVVTLIFDPIAISAFFSVGLWTLELFLIDAVNTAGVLWGAIEIEVRNVYEEAEIPVYTGALNFTGYAPTVRYDFITPGIAGLALSGVVPIITVQRAVVPGLGALAFVGYPPAITDRLVPAAGSLTLSGLAPTVT